eukprot:122132_1
MVLLLISILLKITSIKCTRLFAGRLSTPARGWNSWDSFLTCINETQVIQNALSVEKYLKPYGYEYVIIDGGWSQSNNNITRTIDEYGRPQPWPTKYPHGFKWLSDQIHSMGLKFGVWVGRG